MDKEVLASEAAVMAGKAASKDKVREFMGEDTELGIVPGQRLLQTLYRLANKKKSTEKQLRDYNRRPGQRDEKMSPKRKEMAEVLKEVGKLKRDNKKYQNQEGWTPKKVPEREWTSGHTPDKRSIPEMIAQRIKDKGLKDDLATRQKVYDELVRKNPIFRNKVDQLK